MRYCDCGSCEDQVVANDDHYEAKQVRIHQGYECWAVVGPWHDHEHVTAVWECASEDDAETVAQYLNDGWVPPKGERDVLTALMCASEEET